MYTRGQLHVYIQVNTVEVLKSITLEHDWKQHDSHSACVIARQYSFATCVSLRFSYREETSGVSLKNIIISGKLIFF